ncbi:MAG: dethiobiotin synthase [Mycobacterium sp.]
MSVVLVTGTGTGVGKTIVTAALACAARLAGVEVAVCKPVQTGTAAGDDDLGEVIRLAGVSTVTGPWRYPEPLAPVAAAQRAGLPLPTRAQLTDAIGHVDRAGRLTFVEGAGGLLVEVGADGVTLRDLALDLAAPVLLVAGPELGTLNYTALTLEALAAKGVSCAGLVIGWWPAHPCAAESTNRAALAGLAPLRGVLPGGAGRLTPEDFSSMAERVFDPCWIRELVGG